MKTAFISWSGGKDSCMAMHYASTQGFQPARLLTTITEDKLNSRGHGISVELLTLQAEALGLPFLHVPTSWDEYEAHFKEALDILKEEGIGIGIFGDICFNAHRQWVEEVCGARDVQAVLPLWGKSEPELLEEFVSLGYESIVIAARDQYFGSDILGKKLDPEFLQSIDELNRTKSVSHCGEAGEYHTIVVNGPLFKKRLEITAAEKEHRTGHWFYNISDARLMDK